MSGAPESSDNTMRTPAEEAALCAFIDAATSDDDPGHPNGAAFIPWEPTAHCDRLLWRYLREGRPAILVSADTEPDFLLEPLSRGACARLRARLMRRIAVAISCRCQEGSSWQDSGPLELEIGPHPMSRLRTKASPPTATPRHLAEMAARGEVRLGNGSRHVPKPVKPTGDGKTAAEHVSEGRR